MTPKDYYAKEAQEVVGFILKYQQNYKLSDFDLDVPGIEFERYKRERTELTSIKKEEERMRATAILEVKLLKGHLKSLTDVLFGLGEEIGN